MFKAKKKFYFDNEVIDLSRHKFISSLNFYLRNSCREAKRRKLYYCLAFFSVLIVVCATAVSQSVISYAPLILLKAAESSRGARDVIVRATGIGFNENDGYNTEYVRKRLLLNTTRIEQLVDPVFPKRGAPRYSSNGNTVNPNISGCNATSDYWFCETYATTLIFQWTKREKDIGMGIDLDLPDEIPSGQVIITNGLASEVRVSPGDTIVFRMTANEIIRELVVSYNFHQPITSRRIDSEPFSSNVTIDIPFVVNKTVSSLMGKFPDGSYGSNLLAEYKYFFSHVLDYLPDNLKSNPNYPYFIEFAKAQIPEQYAQEITFNFENRREIYQDSNFDNIQIAAVGFGSKIADLLGIFPFRMSLPIYYELDGSKLVGMFLGLILNIIIIVLFFLSVILIYNLLMVSVETRTFEMGVLRMVGLNKMGLVELILIQALSFVIPGIAVGMVLSFPFLGKISSFLEERLQADIPSSPTAGATTYAILIGILIPIVSSYYPLKEALLQNLNLALDLVHSKTSAVQIRVELDMKKIPWTKITFGVLTVLFGIAVYILIPMALLSFDIGLLLGIFFGVLLGLLLGLVLISLNFQHLMERFVTNIFFFWQKPTFRSIILKNLVAHKIRNRKTSVMYALSLGFVIFLVVSLNLQLDNMGYMRQQQKGGLMVLEGEDGALMNKALIENHIAQNLSGVVESYSWISENLDDYLKGRGVSDVQITHRGKLITMSAQIVAVSPNIFKSTLKKYLKIAEKDEKTGLDLGEQLYTPRGSQGAIVGSYYAEELGLSLNPQDNLVVQVQAGVNSNNIPLRVLAILDGAPAFRFSNIPSVDRQHVLVSFPTWARMAGMNHIHRINDIPVKKCIIKVYGDSDENMDIAYKSFDDLRTLYYPDLTIYDYRDYDESVKGNQEAIGMIFMAVEVVVFILCLFSLITSMSTNIMEQSKEVAVLRAVGVTKIGMVGIYIAEAFVLVFSSALFGVLIGVLVSWTMSAQQVLFTQIPLTFKFPTQELIVVFVASVISAIASTLAPALRIVRQQIAHIIRSG